MEPIQSPSARHLRRAAVRRGRRPRRALADGRRTGPEGRYSRSVFKAGVHSIRGAPFRGCAAPGGRSCLQPGPGFSRAIEPRLQGGGSGPCRFPPGQGCLNRHSVLSCAAAIRPLPGSPPETGRAMRFGCAGWRNRCAGKCNVRCESDQGLSRFSAGALFAMTTLLISSNRLVFRDFCLANGARCTIAPSVALRSGWAGRRGATVLELKFT